MTSPRVNIEREPLVDKYTRSIVQAMFTGTRAASVKLDPEGLAELIRSAFNTGARWQREGKL